MRPEPPSRGLARRLAVKLARLGGRRGPPADAAPPSGWHARLRASEGEHQRGQIELSPPAGTVIGAGEGERLARLAATVLDRAEAGGAGPADAGATRAPAIADDAREPPCPGDGSRACARADRPFLYYCPTHDDWFRLRPVAGADGPVVHFRRVEGEGERRGPETGGGLVHACNNMLAVVTANLEMLADVPTLGDDDRRAVETALGAGERAARLLAGAGATLAAPGVELRRLVEETLPLLRRALGPELTVHALLAGDLAPLPLAAGALRDVLCHLALDAREATRGRGRLVIEAVPRRIADDGASTDGPRPGRHVRLSVAHGPAAGDGDRPGLARARRLAETVGGHVGVERAGDGATTVTLHLPVATAAAGPDDVAGEAAADGVRVLVVEDEPSVRDIVVRNLRRLGYEVGAVGDAEAALHTLASVPFDVVVADIGLPGAMNGLDLARRVPATHGATAVVLMSADPAAALGEAAPPDGVDVLAKPVRRAELARAVAAAARRA